MDAKKEILNSVVSAVTQKSADISMDLLTRGKVQEKPVTLKRVGTGAVLTTVGVVMDGSGIKGTIARIARSLGMTSLAKSAIDTVINQVVSK